MTINEIVTYKTNYSDASFWSKLKKFAIRLGGQTTYYVLILYYTLKSPDVSFGNKAIIMGALGYLILPIDLIPDVIPLLGLTDDAAAIKLAYDTVQASVTPEIRKQARAKLDKWFKTRNTMINPKLPLFPPRRHGNPLIDYFLTHAYFHKRHDMSLGNYDTDDDDDDDENDEYDPDEDLRMMFDDEEYAEMHESY